MHILRNSTNYSGPAQEFFFETHTQRIGEFDLNSIAMPVLVLQYHFWSKLIWRKDTLYHLCLLRRWRSGEIEGGLPLIWVVANFDEVFEISVCAGEVCLCLQ